MEMGAILDFLISDQPVTLITLLFNYACFYNMTSVLLTRPLSNTDLFCLKSILAVAC